VGKLYSVHMEKSSLYAITIIAVTLYAVMGPLLKKANQDLPAFLVMAISMFGLFLGSLVLHFIFDEKVMPSKENIMLLLGVGIINIAAFYLMLVALKGMPVWHYQMFALIIPVISAIVAYYVLGETFSSRLFIGLLIVSIGIFIALRPA